MIYATTEIYIAAICHPPQANGEKKQTQTFHVALYTLKCNVFSFDRSDDGSIKGFWEGIKFRNISKLLQSLIECDAIDELLDLGNFQCHWR